MGGKSDKPLIVNGKRLDGRSLTDLRSLKITAGVLKQAQGSCMVEWGKNKVVAGVYGPREVFPKHQTDPTKAIIKCKYAMSPFSGLDDHGRAGPNRRATEIGKVAKHVFENVVLVNQFPKTMIDIAMEVLQSDGGTRVSAITAASVALVDAGIPCKDLVQGVAVGKIDGELVVDLSKDEDNFGESDQPAVVSLRANEILLYQMDGFLEKAEIQTGLKRVFDAAKVIRQKQIDALASKYYAVEQELNANGNGNGSNGSQ